MKPKSLFVEEQQDSPEITINVDLHEHDQHQLSSPIYKSPLQILIDELEDDVRVKSVELDSARDHLSHLENKFSNSNAKIDKSKLQCRTFSLDLDTQSGIVLKGHVRGRSIAEILTSMTTKRKLLMPKVP